MSLRDFQRQSSLLPLALFLLYLSFLFSSVDLMLDCPKRQWKKQAGVLEGGVHLWRTFLDWSLDIHPIPLMMEPDPDVDRGETGRVK